MCGKTTSRLAARVTTFLYVMEPIGLYRKFEIYTTLNNGKQNTTEEVDNGLVLRRKYTGDERHPIDKITDM